MVSIITAKNVAKLTDFFDPPGKRAQIEEYLGGEPWSLLLLGHAGSGKSTFASSCPGLMVLQADNKGAGLPDDYKNRSRTFKHGEPAYDTAIRLLRTIEADYKRAMEAGIKTIVVDTFTAFCAYMEMEILLDTELNPQGSKTMRIQDYGTIGQRISEIIRVAKEAGMNLVCVTHLDDSQVGPDGFPILMPSLTGRKIEARVPGMFDHVVLMQNEGGKFKATLKSTPECPILKLGMKPSMYREAPSVIEDFTYKKFMAVLDGTIKIKSEGGKK